MVTLRLVFLTTDIYLRAIHNHVGFITKVSAVLYYLSCYRDLISALLLPLSPSLGPGADVVSHFQK